MKILLIEDEKDLAQSIIKYLSGEQYLCEHAADYNEALQKINTHEYDCILLDIMLPHGNGMDLLKKLRAQKKEEGVIIISAKDALEDKINGLKIGADDYLAKPFHLPELSARIYSVIRRKSFANSNMVQQDGIKIDMLAKTVFVNDIPVLLTKKELELLLYFMGNKNRVISKSALAEHISGDLADMLDSYDFIYAHIKNLKKKLQEANCPNYLKTLYGLGYKWEI